MANTDRTQEMKAEVEKFQLPAYNEIPNVGLFLEQVSKYIGEYTAPLECVSLTGSMISNYVKKKIIPNPVRKQYDREQIAYLFFISITKTVLSLEDVQLILDLQRETYDPEAAYEYFREQLKETLRSVFDEEYVSASEGKGASETKSAFASSTESNIQKTLLRKILRAVAHKVYLDKSFRMMREG